MEMIGNKKILEFLSGSVASGRQAHAYLFTGPERVGKTRAALLLAQQVLGIKGEFGLKISEKEMVAKLSGSADFFIVCRERDEKTEKMHQEIKIDQMRDLIGKLQMSSFLNSWKVAIIPEAENLSAGAANSLLKTLEEPKGKTMIILCAPSAGSLLPTIVSRCQTINFVPAKKEEILKSLEDLGTGKEDAENLASIASGRPGIAMEFFRDKEKFEEYKEEVARWQEIASSNIATRFRKLEEWFFKKGDAGDKKEKLEFTLKIWNLLYRDVLYIVGGCEENLANVFAREDLQKISAKYNRNQVAGILSSIMLTKKYLGENVNPRLAIENLVLKF
jgi:DNA polymerase-3 subunit delta'